MPRWIMAYWLLMDGTESNWRLHVTEDVESLRQRLAEPNAEVVEIKTVLGDGLEEQRVHVRPRNLRWWSIVEQPEP